MEQEKEKNVNRKLNKLETSIIADTTKDLFVIHYIDLGYNFIENDINVFYYTANRNKQDFKLPITTDLDYCYRTTQEIVYIANSVKRKTGWAISTCTATRTRRSRAAWRRSSGRTTSTNSTSTCSTNLWKTMKSSRKTSTAPPTRTGRP